MLRSFSLLSAVSTGLFCFPGDIVPPEVVLNVRRLECRTTGIPARCGEHDPRPRECAIRHDAIGRACPILAMPASGKSLSGGYGCLIHNLFRPRPAPRVRDARL